LKLLNLLKLYYINCLKHPDLFFIIWKGLND